MVEPAPDGLARAPRQTPRIRLTPVDTRRARQVPPAWIITARTIGRHAAVFADHVGDAGVLEGRDRGPIAVVAGDIADFIDAAVVVGGTLHAADGGGA